MTKDHPPRRRGWEHALVETASRHQALPFSHENSDCLRLVADIDRAMTGHDPMRGSRSGSRSARGALRTLKRKGFASVAEALAATYPEIAPAMARRGDCGLVETRNGDAVELAAVIVLGDQVMGKSAPAQHGATGVTFVSRDRLVRAFRIG